MGVSYQSWEGVKEREGGRHWRERGAGAPFPAWLHPPHSATHPSLHQYQVFMPFHHPAPVRVKTTVKLVAIRVTGIVFAGHEPSRCQPRGFYGIVLWRLTLEITAWVWGEVVIK